MKAADHNFKRMLAVIMSILLMTSSLGLTAFAAEPAAVSDAEFTIAEDVSSSDINSSAEVDGISGEDNDLSAAGPQEEGPEEEGIDAQSEASSVSTDAETADDKAEEKTSDNESAGEPVPQDLEELLDPSGDGPQTSNEEVYEITAAEDPEDSPADEALPPIDYLTESGGTQTISDYTPLTADTTILSGFVVASGVLVIDTRLEVVESGATLILCDGSRLTINGGIHLPEGRSLTITSQSTGVDRGWLTVNDVANDHAGIGGNSRETGGTVIVNGSWTRTTGGRSGAGIGGGTSGAGGTVTINNGEVMATGGNGGAGIGGGASSGSSLMGAGGTVTINGGYVTAAGTNGCAVIPSSTTIP